MKTNRRAFLASATGATAAGAMLAMKAAEAKSVAAPRWKTGVGLNGFMSSAQRYKKEYPIWEALDFVTAGKFDGIELVEGWPMGGYPGSGETKRIAALKRMYDQYGLRIYTLQTGGSGSYSVDPEARKNWQATFADRIRLGKQLGCAFIGNWPGGGLEGNPNVDQAIENLVLSYREAAKMAADAGMYFSFEIEPGFVFNTLDHLQRILGGVDNPACKTNYDTSHFDVMSGGIGKPEEMLKKLGVDKIGHIHLTDCDGTVFESSSRHLPCGDGHCDIHASLKTLWDGGYTGWIMIDAWLIEDSYRAYHQGKQAIDNAQNEFIKQ